MAKKGRFPERCSADVVPILGRSYMLLSESEGSGISERVGTEIMASEDSCTPLRKCIRSTVDRQDNLGVPTQVLPMSNVSRSERKDLALRLRRELDQVRILQKRVELQRTNGVALSSSNNILSCNSGKNPPPSEEVPKSVVLTPGQGRNSDSSGLKGPGWNCNSSAKLERAEQGLASSTANPIIMKQCETLLGRLMSHQYGWVFNAPVDVVKLNIPDYLNIIKHPMDLGTVKKKIASGLYSGPMDFLADVRLTFLNAMKYNPRGHDVHVMADTLSKFFEVRWKAIEKKISANNNQNLPPKSSVSGETGRSMPMPLSKKRKASSMQEKAMPQHVERIMTDQEKHNLGRELEALLGEMPVHIVNFLRAHSSSGRETAEDEIEIDINELSDETLFTLRKLIDDYLQENKKNSAKAEPCEIELLNESGLSNSSMQLCKVNLSDEDVDIGGSEPPVSSCPTVGIANHMGHRSSKCISPGFSGGKSASNSSSSGSEICGAKAASPTNEKLATGSDINRMQSVDNILNGNDSISLLDQPELNSHQDQPFVEAKSLQDEKNAQYGKHVSPTKLYRAALLKNRFADTILKAREKTLKQGEKGDPERLRREREELEMQRKKERARLQAEAKAAEDARRRAEAEAAAEARRKRELEREAAREALQKMERTVEINANCGFLEDLERLTAAPPELLLSSVDETSPEHSQDGLGSFNFGGSNPLEQLGLFMKMDEDEEEAEPLSSPNIVNDVEEGEID